MAKVIRSGEKELKTDVFSEQCKTCKYYLTIECLFERCKI